MRDRTGPQNNERRRHPRFAEDTQVMFVEDCGTGEFRFGRLKDLSANGIRLETPFDFPCGSRLYLGIFLTESQEPLVAHGVVQNRDTQDGEYSLGLQFLSVSMEQRRAIERLTAYLRDRYGCEAADERKTEALVRQVKDETWWQ